MLYFQNMAYLANLNVKANLEESHCFCLRKYAISLRYGILQLLINLFKYSKIENDRYLIIVFKKKLKNIFLKLINKHINKFLSDNRVHISYGISF